MSLRPCQWFCLIKSAVGVLLGFSAFLTFFFWYRFTNYEAGIWAFCTGVTACICLHLHYLQCKEQLVNWHSKETLSGIEHLGFVIFLISSGYFAWYLFFGFYHHKGLYPISDSPYIKAVWAFLTSNFGFMLFLSSNRFSEYVNAALRLRNF